MDEFNQGPDEKAEVKKKEFLSKVKNGFRKLFDKDGFYIILFICICIVATTAVWVSTNNMEKTATSEESEDLDLVGNPYVLDYDLTDLDEEDDTSKVVDDTSDEPSVKVVKIDNNDSTKEEVKKETKEVTNVTNEKEALPKEEQKTNISSKDTVTSTENNTKSVSMITPLVGSITKVYAKDSLVYSKTLEQWTTHRGIDISAKEGSVVRASLDGVVKSIEKDPTMGIVITIDHGDNLLSKYSCVSTDEMVKEGKEVKKGDPISGVGKGVGFELAQGPHLHFEVLKDGEAVDPTLYIPEIVD